MTRAAGATRPSGGRRLLLFLPYLPPYPSAGSMRATSLVHGLAVEGSRRKAAPSITIYTATPDPAPIYGAEVVPLPVRFPENTSSFLRRLLAELTIGAVAAARILRRSRRGDLILMSSPLFVPCLILGLGAALLRRRYVLDIRDLYPLVYADAGLLSKSSLAYRVLARLERVWLGSAALVLAATAGLARHVRDAGTQAEVVTVYNGFPERLARIEAQKRPGFTACFHGVLGQFQDIESVVQVAELLAPHGIDVVVVGYGSKAAILDQARLPNLHALGRLPFEETIDVVSGCHVGLCLRRAGEISSDAFPVKVWECLGLGLPSVVTPHCEAGDFLEAHGAGMQFEAGDVASIAEWILRLRDDPGAYADYAERCRAVRKDFTRERVGEKAAAAILDLLGGSDRVEPDLEPAS